MDSNFYHLRFRICIIVSSLTLAWACAPQELDVGERGDAGVVGIEDAFDAGRVQADAGPPLGAVCGDGRIDEPEVCDGEALNSTTCRSLGFESGTLGCKASCNDFDTEACNRAQAIAIAPLGQSIQILGAVSNGSPTWKRPGFDCSPTFAEDSFFEARRVFNSEDVVRSVRLSVSFENRGSIHVYRAPFFAQTPTDNCITGDETAIENIALNPGENLILLLSSSGDGNAGSFSVDLTTVDDAPAAECGNNRLEDGEACEASDFGGQSCASRGYLRGELGCDNCRRIIESDCANTLVNSPPIPIAARGNSITLEDTLSGPPFWNRPSESCQVVGDEVDHSFRVHSIVNNTGSAQVLRVDATWQGDGFLHAYRNPFDARRPSQNCLEGDDDLDGLTNSQIADLNIAAGERLEIVASSFRANTDVGEYTIVVRTQEAARCGNGERESQETCDGADLNNATCFSEGHSGGTLSCSAQCASFDAQDCFDYPASRNIASAGGNISLVGNVGVDDARWAPPTTGCEANSGDADHNYQVHLLRNNSGQDQTISLRARWNDDGMLFVYRRFTFVPALPTQACIEGNDDAGSQDESLLEDIDIAAGEELVAVTTGFRPGAIGSYTLDVSTGRQSAAPREIAPKGLAIRLEGSLDSESPKWRRMNADCSLGEGAASNAFELHRIVNRSGA